MPDEPVPFRRAAIGCLALALIGLGFAALVRPTIFFLAPPRDDSVVVVATTSELSDGPILREQILARSYGWLGERDAGDGRVQVFLVVTSSSFAAATVVNAASPVADDACRVEIGPDRLIDCEGHAWTFAGLPIDPADPPLQRFPAEVDAGSVIADLTRTAEP